MAEGYQRCHTPTEGGCDDWGVPNKPKTPVRSFRIPDDIYLPAKAKAEEEGDSLTVIVREALLDYVGEDD